MGTVMMSPFRLDKRYAESLKLEAQSQKRTVTQCLEEAVADWLAKSGAVKPVEKISLKEIIAAKKKASDEAWEAKRLDNLRAHEELRRQEAEKKAREEEI